VIVSANSVRGSDANSKLELGVIGSGSRGKFIAELFEQHTNTKVVALHDYFVERVSKLGDQLKVEPARRYTGLDGYRELVQSKLDAVAIESPPYFHPEQTVTALAARKHVYLAKPIAVDVPGCLMILDATRKVQGKLSVLVDFQTRNDPIFREAVKRVHEGAIGKLTTGHVYYHARANRPRTRKTDSPVARVRNWLFDKALSGDIIVEQNVHVLDVANWLVGGHPLKAQGTGRRSSSAEFGDYWDEFLVTLWYPNGVMVDFSGLQYLKGYDDICTRIYGSAGTVDTHYSGDVRITGDNAWPGGSTQGLYTTGAVNNIKDFHASISSGKYLHDTVAPSAESTMAGILGRMAAYEGRPITWDEMLKRKARIDANLQLPPNGPEIV
jgi:predicted dehydrogenase